MRVLCVLGRHQYGAPSRGVSTEYASFLPALQNIGHHVIHLESQDRTTYSNFRDLNQALLKSVNEFRPKIIFVVQRDYEIWTETLERISQTSDSITVCWTTDDSWKYREISRFIGKYYDVITTTYPSCVDRYHKDGIANVVLTQWAANSAYLQPPKASEQCAYKVSFVGAAHGNRTRFIEDLESAGVHVECFGHGWPNGSVPAEQIPFIMRDSVISLNFANTPALKPGGSQIKARNFEVPGAGGFLLTEYVPGLEKYYMNNHEITTFSSVAELITKIKYYTENTKERDAIALAGYERTVSEHTYEQRMRSVLDFAITSKRQDLVGKSSYSSLSHDPYEMHRLNPMLRKIRTILEKTGVAIFGARRGPRFARRLVFELSWRVAGEHTFSAAGWPGRMFPEQ